ncbi:MAG: Gfo/Idh/MocA family oxidoreductase [Phycisphaerae bacterium]|nr:Gfo/Idh/MocA family oxidoreductase [Phycisphaerae bacterium]
MPNLTRRDLLVTSAGLAGATLLADILPGAVAAPALGRASRLKVGVIGCGGRGTGAAADILHASPEVEILALGDVFPERVESAASNLAKEEGIGPRAQVPRERRFTGFDAYQKVLALKPDIVILATPPHFRPVHFAAAIDAGCHVFFEKPVAVDPAGVRTVLAAAAKARERKLSVVTGTQRRHERCYLEAIQRVRDGQIGDVLAARVYWNQGSLWMHKRRPEWSDMEWQLRNWLYFAWLSGDHIVEQHVHNIDAAHWVLDTLPAACSAMGGRQVRTHADYGHAFDHFAVDFDHPGGVTVQSYCRQIDGCHNRVEEVFTGTKGTLITSSGRAEIRDRSGATAWKFQGENPNPYVVEHQDLVASVTGAGPYVNEGERIAHSTLAAIMGRMSAYTGKHLTWKQALESKLDLSPGKYEMGPLATPEVAVPGKTPLI